MNKRMLIFQACMFLTSVISVNSTACSTPPPCPPCYDGTWPNCVYQCNSANCETCVDGQCKVCGGDTCKTCCNGTCCNKADCKVCVAGNCIKWQICSETMSPVPSNRDRTTLGIGEQTRCYTDPSVSVTWSVSGDGSVYPSSGESTWYSAEQSPGNGTVIATWTCFCEETRSFTIIAPSYSEYSKNSDNPPWIAWSSGDKYLGSRTLFDVTVTSTSVSFYNVSFSENFGSGSTDTWPDGTTWYSPTGPYPFSVDYSNHTLDTQSTGLYNSNKLYNGSSWCDFNPRFSLPDQYLDGTPEWITYFTATAGRNYHQGSRGTEVLVGGQTGSLQGPWQQ